MKNNPSLVMLLPALALSSWLTSCNSREPEAPEPNCSIPATVQRLTTPDSCRSLVLALAGNVRLRPVGPLWQAFHPQAGQRVRIEYSSTTDSSGVGCRVRGGRLVRITCIHLDTTPTGTPTGNPSTNPTGTPTGNPSTNPAGTPTGNPPTNPTGTPTGTPHDTTRVPLDTTRTKH